MSLDEYFMRMAEVAKLRSSCTRRHVGSVLVIKGRIVGTGYNNAPSGVKHCEDVGCTMENGHCIRALHSEENCIANSKCDLTGATIYITTFPCLKCLRLLRNHGISTIVFREDYPYSDAEKIILEEMRPLFIWRKYEGQPSI